MRAKVLPILLAVLFLGASPALAQERFIYGARSFGMGGTAVAAVEDATAVVANPAALGWIPATDFQFPIVSADAEIRGNIFRVADDVADTLEGTSLDDLLRDMEDASTADVRKRARQITLGLVLYDLTRLDDPSQGAKARGVSGPAYRYKNFAFGLTGTLEAALGFQVDLKNGLALGNGGFDVVIPTDEIDSSCVGGSFCAEFAQELAQSTVGSPNLLLPEQAEQLVLDSDVVRLEQDPKAQDALRAIVSNTAEGGLTLNQNQTGALTVGVALAEFAFGYGRRIADSPWSLGGTARVIVGETYSTRVELSEFADEDFFGNWSDRDVIRRETRLGLDLGAMFRPSKKWTLGLTGTNLNEPTFDLALSQGEEIRFDAQFTLGAAWRPARWVTVAADFDLNEADSAFVDDSGFRYGRIGAEFVPVRPLALRVGVFENFAANLSSRVWTGGLGVRIGRFELALAGIVADQTFDIEGDRIGSVETFPAGAGVSFAVGWNPPWNRTHR